MTRPEHHLTEEDLEKYFDDEAKRRGIYTRRMSARGRKGFPDRVAAKHGDVVFVELKSPKGTGKLSKSQEKEIARMRLAGMDVRVLWTKAQVLDLMMWLNAQGVPHGS